MSLPVPSLKDQGWNGNWDPFSFSNLAFLPSIALQVKGSSGWFEGKNMSITLKTPLCFPEPQAGQDIAALLQEWSGTWHRKMVWILWKRLLPEQKTLQLSLNYKSGQRFSTRWEISRKKIISCLKESSKYILTWMLIFCFKFSHIHDLSLYCQHHYLILPVSSTQVLPSVWCIDHVMAGCGWQEFWRGKMWIGCACFSLDITWVLCFKQWGDTQQKVLREQGKCLEWLNAEYIQHRVLITSVWLYLFFSLLCPPLAQDTGEGLIHHCSHCPFCYTWHSCPAKHLLH